MIPNKCILSFHLVTKFEGAGVRINQKITKEFVQEKDKKIRQISQELEATQTELEQTRQQQVEVTTTLEMELQRHEQKSQKLYQELQQKHSTFEQQYKERERDLNKQLSQATTSIQLHHEEKRDLNQQIQKANEEKRILNRQLQKLITALQDKNDKEKDLKQQLKEANMLCEQQHEEKKRLDKQLNNLLQQHHTEKSDLNRQLLEARTLLQRQHEVKRTLDQQLQESDNQLQLQHEEKSDLNKQLEETNNLLQQEHEEKKILNQRLQDLIQLHHKEKSELNRQLQETSIQLQQEHEEKKILNQQLQDLIQVHHKEKSDLNQQLQEITIAYEQIQQANNFLEESIQQLRIEAFQQRRQSQTEQQDYEDSHWVVSVDEVNVTQELIGKGGWAEVRVANFRGIKVAAKCLHEIILSDYNIAIFTREMSIAARVRHPNLLQFIGATLEGKPIILSELMPTSLRKELEKTPLTRTQIIKIGKDVCQALNYIHLWKPHPILHRDVSSPNVLLEPCGNGLWKAKLSDYGSANLAHQICTTAGPGSPAYSAPEAPFPQNHSPAMDVYSFGVLLMEMILRRPPPPTISERQLQADTIQWKSLKPLVQRCIAYDSQNRLTTRQILLELDNL